MKRGWFENGLFMIMGPAQLGDPHAPMTYQPPAEALHCRTCGRLWDEHRVDRTQYTTIAHCPGSSDLTRPQEHRHPRR